jgi:hypothetical protein
MTDHDDPADRIDDLASAQLDGVTMPDEAARAATDPAVADRLERLRAVRDQLRATAATDPVDPARRERAIAAALAAYDADADAEGDAATTAAGRTVVPLAARGQRGRSSTALRVAGVAAALLLLALTVPLLGRLGSDDDRADLASGDASTEESAEARDLAGAGATTTAGDDAASAFSALDAAPLGSFDTVDELASAVAALGKDAPSQAAAAEAAPTAGGAADAASDEQASRVADCATTAGERAGGTVAFQGYAVLDGETVVVVVIDEGDDARTLVVLDEGCSELATRPL